MTSQVQVERAEHEHSDVDDIEHIELKSQEKAAELSAETEDLLADIDELLSELPQDLAVTFVQKGGE